MNPEEARGWLGVDENVDEATIKKAWKTAAQRLHPDKAKNEFEKEQLNKMMQNVNAAYETLTGKREATNQKDERYWEKDQEERRREQHRKAEEKKKEKWKREQEREEREQEEKRRKSVKRGQILLGIIVIISVLFIVNPFSNQPEVTESVPIIVEPSVVKQPEVVEQQVVKQTVIPASPVVKVVPTIESVPVRSMILAGECESNAKEWGRKNGRSEQAITEHTIFFGMYENVCAKAVVVFDLNEFEGLEINSMMLTFNDKIGSYGRTCHGDGFWTVSNTRTCLEPTDSELKYKIQDSLSCMGDVFQESENWQNVNSWVNPSGATTISLDSIAIGEGRYLCMVFSQKGNDIATENDNYFRIWALGNFRIEATYG